MNIYQFRNAFLAGTCLLLLATGGSLSLAAKPGGGGGGAVPPGTIYYYQGDGYGSMKADGSGKASAPSGNPSYQRHGGSRWFLQTRYIDFEEHGVDEVGNPIYWSVYDVVAVNETGGAISLATARGFDVGATSWSKDDSFISYTSAVDTGDGVEGGLFIVELNWDLGLPAPEAPIPAFQAATTIWGEVSLTAHDWSPAGNAFVFQFLGEDGIEQLAVATFTDTGVVAHPLTPGVHPAWSPNGSRIAYAKWSWQLGDELYEIWTVNPDGSAPARLTQSSATSNSRRSQLSPTWSPDSAHVAFTEILRKGNNSTRNVARIPAAGGTSISLTSNGASGNPKWRP